LELATNKFSLKQEVICQAAPKTVRQGAGRSSTSDEVKPTRHSKGMPRLSLGGHGTGLDANPPECGLSDREQRVLDGRPVGIYMTESAAEAARDRSLHHPSLPRTWRKSPQMLILRFLATCLHRLRTEVQQAPKRKNNNQWEEMDRERAAFEEELAAHAHRPIEEEALPPNRNPTRQSWREQENFSLAQAGIQKQKHHGRRIPGTQGETAFSVASRSALGHIEGSLSSLKTSVEGAVERHQVQSDTHQAEMRQSRAPPATLRGPGGAGSRPGSATHRGVTCSGGTGVDPRAGGGSQTARLVTSMNAVRPPRPPSASRRGAWKSTAGKGRKLQLVSGAVLGNAAAEEREDEAHAACTCDK